MKYLMISPGLCVLPTMEEPEYYGVRASLNLEYEKRLLEWEEHLKDCPKLPTTCTLPEGEWFEGKEQVLLSYGQGSTWYDLDEVLNTDSYHYQGMNRELKTRIVPVEQKDEPEYALTTKNKKQWI